MGGTKGSHIVLDHPELLAATGGRELFFENKDGRIVLIYPLKGRVLVGTTDLEHDMARPDRVHRGRGRLLHRPRPAGAARHRGRPRRRSSTASRACGRCPATATSPPASSRATTGSSAAPLAGGRRHRAEPRRRQVDDVPRLGGAPRRPRARRCSPGRGAARPRACRSAADAGSRRPSARGGSGSPRTAQGLPAGPRRDAARPLRHRRRRRDRGDRRRPGRRAARPTLPVLQHRRAAPPRPHRGRRAPRRRADAAHEPRVHGRGVTAESALEVAEAIAPVLGWDAAHVPRRDRSRRSRGCTRPIRRGRPRHPLARPSR